MSFTNTELPSAPEASRKEALLAGAALLEVQLRQLRKQAMHADGNPYQEQYKVTPSASGHERLMLDVLHKAQCVSILREMARLEE